MTDETPRSPCCVNGGHKFKIHTLPTALGHQTTPLDPSKKALYISYLSSKSRDDFKQSDPAILTAELTAKEEEGSVVPQGLCLQVGGAFQTMRQYVQRQWTAVNRQAQALYAPRQQGAFDVQARR